jgi:hypothetical protein
MPKELSKLMIISNHLQYQNLHLKTLLFKELVEIQFELIMTLPHKLHKSLLQLQIVISQILTWILIIIKKKVEAQSLQR